MIEAINSLGQDKIWLTDSPEVSEIPEIADLDELQTFVAKKTIVAVDRG